MVLIICGSAAPLIVALLAWIGMRMPAGRRGPTRPRPRDARWALAAESRWEGLTEEIARRGAARRRSSSDEIARSRHLAAVLPSDARR